MAHNTRHAPVKNDVISRQIMAQLSAKVVLNEVKRDKRQEERR